MRIRFLGAAGEVTGSCHLVESAAGRFLVDCGMFQGGRESDSKNLAALRFDLRSVDFVLLTHAHLDHSGLLPRLTTLGFRGTIHCTSATADLARVILLDSAHIQEKESEWENRRRRRRDSRRPPAERAPLYTVSQAQRCLQHFQGIAYDTEFAPTPGIRCRFQDAGHILGSAIVEVWSEAGGRSCKLVFSGDLGQPARPVMRDPAAVEAADVLVVESTYGNRCHKSLRQTEEELVRALTDTLERKGGNVVIPAFSVGRTQELLFILIDLTRRRLIRPPRIYIDSPMALAATELTLRNEALLDDDARALLAWQRDHPDMPHVRFVQSVEESVALNEIRSGALIISASGMCEAGRIKYHLLHNLPRPECSVIFAGFQAAGTLGRRLVDGARRVTIHSESVPVRADIHTIGGLSAHADRDALLRWLRNFRRPPRHTFVVHGEAETARGFGALISSELGWPEVVVPQSGTVAEVG